MASDTPAEQQKLLASQFDRRGDAMSDPKRQLSIFAKELKWRCGRCETTNVPEVAECQNCGEPSSIHEGKLFDSMLLGRSSNSTSTCNDEGSTRYNTTSNSSNTGVCTSQFEEARPAGNETLDSNPHYALMRNGLEAPGSCLYFNGVEEKHHHSAGAGATSDEDCSSGVDTPKAMPRMPQRSQQDKPPYNSAQSGVWLTENYLGTETGKSTPTPHWLVDETNTVCGPSESLLSTRLKCTSDVFVPAAAIGSATSPIRSSQHGKLTHGKFATPPSASRRQRSAPKSPVILGLPDPSPSRHQRLQSCIIEESGTCSLPSLGSKDIISSQELEMSRDSPLDTAEVVDEDKSSNAGSQGSLVDYNSRTETLPVDDSAPFVIKEPLLVRDHDAYCENDNDAGAGERLMSVSTPEHKILGLQHSCSNITDARDDPDSMCTSKLDGTDGCAVPAGVEHLAGVVSCDASQRTSNFFCDVDNSDRLVYESHPLIGESTSAEVCPDESELETSNSGDLPFTPVALKDPQSELDSTVCFDGSISQDHVTRNSTQRLLDASTEDPSTPSGDPIEGKRKRQETYLEPFDGELNCENVCGTVSNDVGSTKRARMENPHQSSAVQPSAVQPSAVPPSSPSRRSSRASRLRVSSARSASPGKPISLASASISPLPASAPCHPFRFLGAEEVGQPPQLQEQPPADVECGAFECGTPPRSTRNMAGRTPAGFIDSVLISDSVSTGGPPNRRFDPVASPKLNVQVRGEGNNLPALCPAPSEPALVSDPNGVSNDEGVSFRETQRPSAMAATGINLDHHESGRTPDVSQAGHRFSFGVMKDGFSDDGDHPSSGRDGSDAGRSCSSDLRYATRDATVPRLNLSSMNNEGAPAYTLSTPTFGSATSLGPLGRSSTYGEASGAMEETTSRLAEEVVESSYCPSISAPLTGVEEAAHQEEQDVDEDVTQGSVPTSKPPVQDAPKLQPPNELADTALGVVYTWGSGDCDQLAVRPQFLNDAGAAPLPQLILKLRQQRVVSISCGAMHSAVVLSDGRVATWGCNDDLALGREAATGSENMPGIVTGFPEGCHIISLSCGDCHTAAVSSAGDCFLWGLYRDSNGPIGFPNFEIGEGSVEALKCGTPTRVRGLEGRAMFVLSGENHTVCMTIPQFREPHQVPKEELDSMLAGPVVYVWGNNEFGQLGFRVLENQPLDDKDTRQKAACKLLFPAAQYSSRISNISSGKCVFSNVFAGKATTFFGVRLLGDGDSSGSTGSGVRSSGRSRTSQSPPELTVTSGFRYYGCGRSACGEVGVGKVVDFIDQPEELSKLRDMEVTELIGGQFATSCLTCRGEVYTWGKQELTGSGFAAEASTSSGVVAEPQRLTSLPQPVSHIGAGGDTLFAIDVAGTISAWGEGQMYQIGDGHEYIRPVTVPKLLAASTLGDAATLAVTGGSQHSVALVYSGAHYGDGGGSAAEKEIISSAGGAILKAQRSGRVSGFLIDSWLDELNLTLGGKTAAVGRKRTPMARWVVAQLAKKARSPMLEAAPGSPDVRKRRRPEIERPVPAAVSPAVKKRAADSHLEKDASVVVDASGTPPAPCTDESAEPKSAESAVVLLGPVPPNDITVAPSSDAVVELAARGPVEKIGAGSVVEMSRAVEIPPVGTAPVSRRSRRVAAPTPPVPVAPKKRGKGAASAGLDSPRAEQPPPAQILQPPQSRSSSRRRASPSEQPKQPARPPSGARTRSVTTAPSKPPAVQPAGGPRRGATRSSRSSSGTRRAVVSGAAELASGVDAAVHAPPPTTAGRGRPARSTRAGLDGSSSEPKPPVKRSSRRGSGTAGKLEVAPSAAAPSAAAPSEPAEGKSKRRGTSKEKPPERGESKERDVAVQKEPAQPSSRIRSSKSAPTVVPPELVPGPARKTRQRGTKSSSKSPPVRKEAARKGIGTAAASASANPKRSTTGGGAATRRKGPLRSH